jgi:hypothetical protein
MKDQLVSSQKHKWYFILIELVGLLLYVYLTLRLGGVQNNQVSILVDTFLFYFWLVFWQFFFSQFVLPVKTLNERKLVFNRLWRYMIGKHGPAVLIENGEYRKRSRELDRKGPGVALVDTASAIMLRTDTEYTRPAGPGVVFTNPAGNSDSKSEYIAGIVDLRPQIQIIGPKENENPFLPHNEKEKEAAYFERKKRRYQTSGLTRNGIEVVPDIMVSYQINTQPGLGGTEFGYNGPAVRSAITGEGIDPDLAQDDARRKVLWKELPAFLAANLWREAIGMFTLDELFLEKSPEMRGPLSDIPILVNIRRPTGLDFIISWLKLRLTQEFIDEIDPTGQRTGVCIPSPEYKLLKERGIKVNNVLVGNLHFQEEVEKQLVHRWESTWYQQALADREVLDEQLGNVQFKGQEAARYDYSQTILQRLKHLANLNNPTSDEILSELVGSSIHLIVRDPQLQTRLSHERETLLNLTTWLQNTSSIQ